MEWRHHLTRRWRVRWQERVENWRLKSLYPSPVHRAQTLHLLKVCIPLSSKFYGVLHYITPPAVIWCSLRISLSRRLVWHIGSEIEGHSVLTTGPCLAMLCVESARVRHAGIARNTIAQFGPAISWIQSLPAKVLWLRDGIILRSISGLDFDVQ